MRLAFAKLYKRNALLVARFRRTKGLQSAFGRLTLLRKRNGEVVVFLSSGTYVAMAMQAVEIDAALRQ